jgi:hypothetical protein
MRRKEKFCVVLDREKKNFQLFSLPPEREGRNRWRKALFRGVRVDKRATNYPVWLMTVELIASLSAAMPKLSSKFQDRFVS